MKTDTVIGIIGGSGVYDIKGLKNINWTKVDSPFGGPSDEYLVGEFEGLKIVFLPRHGRGHVVSPSQVNYRANIDGMKRLGVTDLISVSAVGSLREDLVPGMFVIVDQFIDRTFAREKSFFGKGLVAHVSVAHPVCSRLGDHIESALKLTDIGYVRGGTYLVMEGPQFSTLAESKLYRQWGCDVIGMTNMPEAKLAREAEICYASVAMVTDFDCWHPDHEDVSVEQVIKVLVGNAEKAKTLIGEVVPMIHSDETAPSCSCKQALEFALITAPDSRDPKLVKKLDAIAGRVLKP
ncbi:MAG: S-methyl-5'-thioadenosine phosphorylase [Burkholderiales bacterium]|nr:S-methyl-5'-thioadenosine phosphorylase [Burkholderiales bacterium]OUT78091.1 MAG: methylthioadenosine phosphorylase [Betaproteobacteria bacterium TMED22]|tara:strand:+ start:20 stop:898 length:879 start_codon:yes stop_codon:yes gene_type:complete